MAHRRLTHLNALRAFEAVARHMSFARAADELAVTSGALSQQVKLLEDYYGVVLFRRHNRRVSLTDEARAILPDLKAGFDSLAGAVSRLQAHHGGGALSISAPPTFSVRWLTPRLGDFARACPDLEVTLDSTDRLVDLVREEIDVAVRYGRGRWDGLTAEWLADEVITPACAPAYLERHPLREPADLHDAQLIHDRAMLEHPGFPTWQAWFDAAGITPAEGQPALHFSSSVTAIEAAVHGQGVVLGRNLMIEAELAAGRLVAPFPQTGIPGYAYYLVYPQARALPAKAVRFRDWITEAFG
jgi:LysR family glycine cleavage system transcriptional activator